MSEARKYSINNVLKYLKDKLSKKERYAFDKEMSKDPFLADAMDGFSQLSPEELLSDGAKLDLRLKEHIAKKKTRKLIPYISIAASVVILFGIGTLMLYNNVNKISERNLAQDVNDEKFTDTIKADYLSPEDSRKLLDEFETSKESESSLNESELFDDKAKVSSPKKEMISKNKAPDKLVESIMIEEEAMPEMDDVELEELIVDEEPAVIAYQQKGEAPEAVLSGKAAGVETKKTIRIRGVSSSRRKSSREGYDSSPVLNFEIQGTIIDTYTKEPLIGAMITQNNNGAISDMEGNFNFRIEDDSLIQVSFIGYKTEELHVRELIENENIIELETDEIALSEVVVVGYGTNKKALNTGAVSEVDMQIETPENLSSTIRTKNARINYNSGFENHAEPVGGIKKFGKYLKSNSRFSPEKNMKVILEFYVYDTGRLGEINVIKTDEQKYSDEAVRLLIEGPEWTPAENNGKTVRELVNLKITFEKNE